MSAKAARFLNSFGRALSAAALYQEGHPALERAIDGAWQDLTDLIAIVPNPAFTLLGETVFFADLPLREQRSWEWSERLSAAGLQRIQFEPQVSRDEFVGFVFEVVDRLSRRFGTSTARHLGRSGIRSGTVALRGSGADLGPTADPKVRVRYSMKEEVETLRWLHDQATESRGIPLVEAETIVRSLSVAMHAEGHLMLPLLELKDFDQYTTTHSLNVAVLAMALAEHLRLSPSEIRAYGLAGLLHDIGKTRIPLDILTKPGKLTDQERDVMNQHPSDGARLILRSEQKLDLAAVVAYEHHIMIDGGGYPTMKFGRSCHKASRLVHVCDVFDALRTDRPYRKAWALEKTLDYIRERSGLEFDPDIVRRFVEMVTQSESRIAVLTSEHEPIPQVGDQPKSA